MLTFKNNCYNNFNKITQVLPCLLGTALATTKMTQKHINPMLSTSTTWCRNEIYTISQSSKIVTMLGQCVICQVNVPGLGYNWTTFYILAAVTTGWGPIQHMFSWTIKFADNWLNILWFFCVLTRCTTLLAEEYFKPWNRVFCPSLSLAESVIPGWWTRLWASRRRRWPTLNPVISIRFSHWHLVPRSHLVDHFLVDSVMN